MTPLLIALVSVALAQPPAAVPTTGTALPQFKPLDDAILEVLAEDRIPGAALAVTKNGRLVYACGYGLADTEARTPVEPNSLFRIASISKPFTAAAVLKLVDEGKLKLDEPVFPLLKLEPVLAPGEEMDPRWKAITVKQLLDHSGGFDREKSGDPMFMPSKIANANGVARPPGPREIIRYVMGRPLDFEPGSRTCYSNFGYCVLGRVIEAVTGEKYGAYVQKAILRQLGITDMRLGRTREIGRLPGEVRYYELSQPTSESVFASRRPGKVPTPYGAWWIEAMDAHGGWVASPVDLVRFLVALSEPDKFPAVKSKSVQDHFKPGYGFQGYLDGASSGFRWMQKGDTTFAVVFNGTAGNVAKAPAAKVWDRLPKLIRAVEEWPTGDLFEKYLK